MSRARSTEGFTVVEVVTAVTILVVAMLGAAALLEHGMVVSGNTRDRIVAANLATQAMEDVRGLAADPTRFTTIPQGARVLAGPAENVNGIQYTVTQDVQFVGQSSSTSSCDTPGSTAGQILQVSEVVTWANMGGTKPVQEVTTLAPPVGAYSSSSGSLAVKVFDAAGNPAADLNVQIAGPLNATQLTTAEGCVYFAFIPPGTYTATIIAGTGVGDQEVAVPSQTASVVVGQTAALQFQYDVPARLAVTMPSPLNTPGAPPYAGGLALSVANTGVQPYGQFSFAGNPAGDTTTSPGLFPYASGYTVFAGNCTDNNPLGKDTNHNPFYPTATPVPVAVAPNTTAPASVQLYALALHVQSSGPTPVPVAGATPAAAESTSFGVPYTAVCTDGTATGSAPVVTLATTNATGDSVTALPLGHWTVTATCTKGAPACPVRDMTGSVDVWVRPDGVYAVDGTGAYTTPFAGPVTVSVS